MKTTTLLLALAAAPLLVPTAEELRELPAEGRTTTTSIALQQESRMVDMVQVMNGEEMRMPGEMRQERRAGFDAVLVDTVTAVEGGRRTGLSRTYEDLAWTSAMEMEDPMGGAHDMSNDLESDLAGSTVEFSEEDGEFVAAFAEGEEGDAELLDGLDPLLPWAAFLPEGDVEAEAEWDVPLEAFEHLLDLSNLAPRAEDDRSEDGGPGLVMVDDPSELGERELDGELTGRLVAVREEEGRRLAEVEVAVEVEVVLTVDGDSLPQGGDEMAPELGDLLTTTSYEGSLTLLWDLEAGALVSLDAELETEEEQQMSLSFDMGQGPMEIEILTSFEGLWSLTVTAE